MNFKFNKSISKLNDMKILPFPPIVISPSLHSLLSKSSPYPQYPPRVKYRSTVLDISVQTREWWYQAITNMADLIGNKRNRYPSWTTSVTWKQRSLRGAVLEWSENGSTLGKMNRWFSSVSNFAQVESLQPCVLFRGNERCNFYLFGADKRVSILTGMSTL